MGRTVVSSLSLGGERVLALLVLGDLVGGVLSALLSLAVWHQYELGNTPGWENWEYGLVKGLGG